jgi:hypothetical protein
LRQALPACDMLLLLLLLLLLLPQGALWWAW